MKYFDFHTHIILKQLFEDNPNIDARISRGDVSGIPRFCSDLPNIIESQAHQSQLANFQDEVIIGAVVYGCESYLAREVIGLQKYLKKESQHKMSITLLQNIVDNKYTAFKDFTKDRTLDKYLQAPQSFNVLNKSSFSSPLPKNKVNVFFVIEGCHSLIDSVNEALPGNPYSPEEILKNLDILLHDVKIIAVNLTHLQQSSLCNHAFAIQLTKSEPFYPRGNGLSSDGRRVIQGMFDRGICIDSKHMSYKSRLDLRKEIDEGKYQSPQPLICSHTGFTGVSFNDWPGFISLKKPVADVYYLEVAKTIHRENSPRRPGAPAFNMTSINLFDEEIAWIVKNEGMIGLSLDRRIIGYVSKYDDSPTGIKIDSLLYVDKEYISKSEWSILGINDGNIGQSIGEDNCVTENDVEESAEGGNQAANEYFFDHVLLHLKHYFQVCYKAGIPIDVAKNHITIGSDYDGLINPFINMPTVDAMIDLKKYIKSRFKFYLQSLTDSREWEPQLNVESFAEDLFYNSGYLFIKSRFNL